MNTRRNLVAIVLVGVATTTVAEEAELAKKLANPVAAMISVPFQYNYDSGYGSEKGYRSVLNIQPVIPISVSHDWNLISRTILPVIDQHNLAGDSGRQSGLGDITQSFFLSPKAPTASGLIWGVGPALVLPSATRSMLGGKKWGAGPSAVLLKQQGGWTYGLLTNHIWSFAGNRNRQDINATFIQPFISHTTSNAWTVGVDTESTYDWKGKDWAVPVNFTVSKLVKIGTQPVSFQVGARYWATAPENGPNGWAIRAGVTFLFPN